MVKLSEMTPEEIIAEVESGEIKSESYNSFTEYVKGMKS